MTNIQDIADMMDDDDEDVFIEDESCSPYNIILNTYPAAGNVDHKLIHEHGLERAYKNVVSNMGYCDDEHVLENWLHFNTPNLDVKEIFVFVLLEHIGYWQNTSGFMTPAVSVNYYQKVKDILVDEEYEYLISDRVIRHLRGYKYEVKYV